MSKTIGGSVHIADDVLADLAGYCAMESYGVVGMASPRLTDFAAQLLPQNKIRKGVRIFPSSDPETNVTLVEVDLFVVIEYGTNLSEVSRNLSDKVVYTLENLAGVTVSRCDIHVVDVRVR